MERLIKGTADSDLTSPEVAELLEAGTIDLKGKDYLQVAYRIKVFRYLNPNVSIGTKELWPTSGEKPFGVRATISMDGIVLAQASKTCQYSGHLAKFAMEVAETGAIGRAINLCGLGSLVGDLDEGDQIAEAPVARQAKSVAAAVTKNITR